ncbi:complex I NDUFA9 subunit family protein [Sphingomicrobium astaxanthinifaciens]|uniref:complex I NDUFA9 subunit family protein n=1 Tax=Sphingomicrobium astaxanthinifaciens TaxID=1227949 RepID=UPI001FCC5514|nr:complex I NDUFA9 subunit family protein [Sphingomicrobium astaxanthinifaciens]MCJ7421544.1 complex I NDUFA9 subunit family protein [Sphingomicrobium astaxanthinifaciens]
MTSDPTAPKIITLIGGGGFIGRYAAEQLLRHNVRLRIAERNPKSAHTLQPLSRVGQIALMPANIERPDTIEAAVVGADAVVNLVGTFDTAKQQALHVEGAATAARLAAAAGASAFVQVSALGADPHGPSHYARTKAEGEEAVRAAFAQATILRPSTVFGAEDEFTNRFAGMLDLPATPILAPDTRFQPVFVRDLGEAIAKAALDPRTQGGKTYEVAGPEALSMRELNHRIAEMAGRKPNFVELPPVMGDLLSSLGFLPGAPLTKDQWLLLQRDNVATGAHPGLEAMGITPTPMQAVAPAWLERFTPGGRFGRAARQG